MIESLTVRGLLSYGWEPVTLPLRKLNVIVGPNASGKTSLLDILDMLRAAPVDPLIPVRSKGGGAAWIHGLPGGDGQGSIAVVLPGPDPAKPLRYRLAWRLLDGDACPFQESLETHDAPALFLRLAEGKASVKTTDSATGKTRWSNKHIKGTGLAEFRGNPLCPEISQVAGYLARIHLLQGWTFGPTSLVRRPADRGLPSDRLEPDGRNLALVLHRLRDDGAAWSRLRDALRQLYPRVDDVETSLDGPTVNLLLREQGLPVPASRISDGTLRWLCLLALLLDPQPAPLICLEEPELGLHPDLIGTLAGLLRDAATRTQLLVTTHSPGLVSEFTRSPEDVVVCESVRGASTLKRLEPDELAPWLEEFSLGHAWLRGAFGGKRG